MGFRKLKFDAHTIKFTSNGIPYLSQFDNVHVASQPQPPASIPSRPQQHSGPDEKLNGLLIRYPVDATHGSDFTPSQSRLRRLQKVIADAVTAAGMDSPPALKVPNPMDRNNIASTPSAPGALYRGTYGQVTTALLAAGLAIAPCPTTGLTNATRLGALFVARPSERGVEFTKLTLWG